MLTKTTEKRDKEELITLYSDDQDTYLTAGEVFAAIATAPERTSSTHVATVYGYHEDGKQKTAITWLRKPDGQTEAEAQEAVRKWLDL